MGAYAIYSGKPIIVPADKLHRTRKRGQIDEIMEMLDKADSMFLDMENERILLMKDGKILNDDFPKDN